MNIIKNIEDYTNFSELLADAAAVFADKIFLVEDGREYSFDAFNRLVNRGARLLAKEGVGRGDVVSIVLKNSVDYLILYFAALRLGGKINPFPFHLGSEEIKEKIQFIGPKAVYAHVVHAEKLTEMGLNVKTVQSDKEAILPKMLEAFSDGPCPHPDVDPDEAAFMYYSSGTTGTPKIIEYSTRSEILAMASLLRSSFIQPPACHLCVLPLGHTAAIRYSIWPCLLTGSKVVLFESFWKVRADFWKIIEKYKVTFLEIVPSILVAILNTEYPELDDCDISSVRFAGCGSAYLSKSLQEKFEEKFKIPLANMYGLSETGATHFDNPFLPGRKRGSIGKPLDIMDVKVLDENGCEVKTGQAGEFAVKGPSLLCGYYRNEAQFASCFKNGYFMTGDLGHVDAEGFHYYVDRKKDLIIKGGVNIVPAQIDEVLLSHADVQDAATVGKPDMFFGEVIKSFVVLKDSQVPDAKELKAHCRRLLGEFKMPSEIEFVRELPKGPSGKVLRRQLREKEFAKL